MSLVAILLIVLLVLALGGFGYGRYYAVPVGEPAPGYANPLGILGAVLVVLLVVWLLTGGLYLHLPPPW